MILEDLYLLLRSGHVQAQGVVDTMTQPVVVLDKNLGITTVNNAFLRTFSVQRDDVIGQSLFDLGNGQWEIPELRHLIESVIPKAAAVVGYEVKHDFPAIGERTFLVDARRLIQTNDSGRDILVTFEDVTERQQHNAEQDFILAETRHRMKNLFAVVRGIAMQTNAKEPAALDYRDTFLGRLDVALRAQEIAASHETADLKTVIGKSVGEPYANRLTANGPAVELASKKVLAVSMIIHELATNAIKYGALSVPEGTIDVEWTLEPGSRERTFLHCEWRESNGPSVSPFATKGYGSELITGMSAQLGGSAELNYEQHGLVAKIRIPM